jgi:uncharacterized RDD family membrane protein YckC
LTAATDAAVIIETPEGVRFALPLAGVVARFLALVIDMLAISALSSALDKLTALIGWLSTDTMIAFSILGYFAMTIGYGIFFEWIWHGQTPGKRVLSLRVMDANGLKLQVSQIAVRNLMRAIDSLPALYLVGGISALLTRRHQRLGDMVANTIVVQQRRLVLPDLLRLNLDDKFNSLTSVPHLAARLRQQVTPALVELAYQALLRRDELSPDVKLEVFRLLADRFRALVKFPADITAGFTDERYVRNALQIALTAGPLCPDRTARPIA